MSSLAYLRLLLQPHQRKVVTMDLNYIHGRSFFDAALTKTIKKFEPPKENVPDRNQILSIALVFKQYLKR